MIGGGGRGWGKWRREGGRREEGFLGDLQDDGDFRCLGEVEKKEKNEKGKSKKVQKFSVLENLNALT